MTRTMKTWKRWTDADVEAMSKCITLQEAMLVVGRSKDAIRMYRLNHHMPALIDADTKRGQSQLATRFQTDWGASV